MSSVDFNFKWVIGVVENVDDEEMGGRVQVRLNGIHEQDKTLLPTKFLPWARLFMQPTTSTSDKGLGRSPTGIEVGTTFLGISLDDMHRKIAICFTWYGSDETGWSQVHPLAKGEESELSKKIAESVLTGMEFSASNKLDEPVINRVTTYPNNDVEASRGGLEAEIDNSNDKVRTTTSHPSGAYTNLDPEGRETIKVTQRLKMILGLCVEYVKGSRFLSVVGDCVRIAKGDIYSSTAGQETRVSKTLLIKTDDGFELVTPEMRVSGDARVGGTLYVPSLRVGDLKADNISCKGTIDGVIKYASEAVKAASVSPPVVPAPGAGAGDTSVTFSYEDNGGDYDFEFQLDETKKASDDTEAS